MGAWDRMRKKLKKCEISGKIPRGCLCLDPLWNADVEVTSQSCHKSRQGELGEGITPTHVSCWPKSDSGEHELPGTSTQVLSYRPKGSSGQRAVPLLQRAVGPVC